MNGSARVNKKTAWILDGVLIFKMVMTVLWVGFLLLAEWLFEPFGIPKPEPMLFVTLLAGAYFALLVGYARGYYARKRSENIRTVVVVGIISNGPAAPSCSVTAWEAPGTIGENSRKHQCASPQQQRV